MDELAYQPFKLFPGRYGVKASSNSAVKYEGTWANGLQDGYGSETYSDGGYYQGQMCRGLRHGFGVRKSAPYGDSQLNNPNKNGQQVTTNTGLSSSMLIHSNSLQSAASLDLEDDSPKPEDGFKPNIDRTLASKNGFVLVAKPLDVPMPSASIQTSSKYTSSSSHHDQASKSSSSGARRNSLTNRLASSRIPGSNQTASLLRGLRLRKQKSTSDLDAIPGSRQAAGRSGGASSDDLPTVPFTLSPEELDITDPNTVETYTGEWRHDKRNGNGICERSDGLKYEGQWHNDMKCGYGVTTFKDGTKQEGKYRNNILIVDSKVKRFFQLGSANIRQRIDDAVKMAQQAQAMSLKKAEIADTRAATARDKADQATTAAVEADRDSQIAFSVARQYSDPQQQLGMQMTNNQQQIMGPSSMMNPQQQHQLIANYTGAEPILPNLGMTSSSLQMRRISHQQQQQTNQYAQGAYQQGDNQQQQQQNMMSLNMNQIQQQQQHDINQGQQYLGPIEPFNGRRGSFRSGSQAPSGYQSTFQGAQARYNPPGPQAITRTQPSDPFSDLFDHYKSAPGSSVPASRRHGLSKQASLDYSQLSRGISVPRQLPTQSTSGEQHSVGGLSRMQRFRMSSMDHAEENQSRCLQGTSGGDQQQQPQKISGESNMQQQLKHLVTSSEDLKQQHQQSSNTNQADAINLSSTPTGSSYILPHSANSSFYGNQTPSPEGQSYRAPSSQQQYYGGHQQQQQMPMPLSMPPVGGVQRFMMKQRDVHSLADEQLYMAAGRRKYDDPLDTSEYANYDFTISSIPRPAKRYMRRTASLSRNTPASASDLRSLSNANSSALLGSTQLHPSSRTLRTGDQQAAIQQQRAGVSPGSFGEHNFQHTPAVAASSSNMKSSSTVASTNNATELPQITANHYNSTTAKSLLLSADSPLSPSNSSHLTIDSTSSSTGALIRKPSLQVRYDPVELGGLMTREEVAALSHAQREQKRLEAELAEKRAEKPLLYLYLSLKDFIHRQKLLISVLVINIFLFKLFADLIV